MKSKILFILHLPPPVHGANMVGEDIRRSALINEAFDCQYINLTTTRSLNKNSISGLQKLGLILRLYAKVLFYVGTRKYDLYYLTVNAKGRGFYKDFGVAVILKMFRCNIVYHYHNKGVSEGKNIWLLNFMYRWQFKNADAILLSRLLYKDVSKYLPETNAHYCANGLGQIPGFDVDEIYNKRQAKDIPQLLFLSNMMKEKGVMVLLEACKILHSKGIRFKMVFIGELIDVSADEFSGFVSANNLGDMVSYEGKKYGTEKHAYFLNSDIFIFPTFYHNETFGLVNLEAMQFALPIISTNEGAIPDLVSNNETGYLVKQRDPEELADKIQFLIENPGIRKQMGVAAKKKFDRLFTLDIFENNLIKIFEKIIGRRRVLFIYKFLPQYRVDFFDLLKDTLSKKNIELQLIYGKSKYDNALKKDEVEIEWAKFIPNRFFKVGKVQLIWQPIIKYLKGTDLVIAQPENKLLINFYLLVGKHFSKYKFAFWGHGRNMQMNAGSLPNRFKTLYLNKCDWWFPYTTGVEKVVVRHHFPQNRVTVVQNAIDTLSLGKYYHQINEAEIKELRDQFGITGFKTGIYCGGIYPEKRIDFIMEACNRIKKEIPDFHMVFIGSGIDSHKVIEASNANKWMHYVGPKFGKERVKYFKISSIQLMPGLVGLGILDSFAMETPIVTTNFPYHSPEIDYLENGVNGIITDNNIDDYSNTVVEILKTEKYFDLIEGCKSSAEKYTVEAMVTNFTNGVVLCLQNGKK